MTASVSRAWRVGTRASALARVQAATVAAALTAQTGRPAELVEISTYRRPQQRTAASDRRHRACS